MKVHLAAGAETGQPNSDALLLEQFNAFRGVDRSYKNPSIAALICIKLPTRMKCYVSGHYSWPQIDQVGDMPLLSGMKSPRAFSTR
jgi:hypothetical protein